MAKSITLNQTDWKHVERSEIKSSHKQLKESGWTEGIL